MESFLTLYYFTQVDILFSHYRCHMEDRSGLDGDTSRSLGVAKFYEPDRQLEYHDWFSNLSTFCNPGGKY